MKKEDIKLIPPNDPRVLSMVAPFTDEALKDFPFKDRKELSEFMMDKMKKEGGIGLSANQLGLPFRMFVMHHPQMQKGQKWVVYNPEIVESSKRTINMKEGCLTFPMIFIMIKRPTSIRVKYEDDEGKTVEEDLTGLPARVFQHEYDHMQGRVFTELVSKFKRDMAYKKAAKEFKRLRQLYARADKNIR